MDALNQLKKASVRIGGLSEGTGFLVASNRIATCWHVVKTWDEGMECEVKIGFPEPDIRMAHVIKMDEATDCAVLGFEPPVDRKPLPMAERLETPTVWEGFGYPGAGKGTGLPIRGEVTDPDSRDQSGRKVMALFAREAAAGAAARLHGFSGTPVLVDGAVVGHVIRHLGDPQDARRPAYGVVFATHISGIRDLLDVATEQRSIDPPRLAEAVEFLKSASSASADEATAATDDASVLIVVASLIDANHLEKALEILESSGLSDLRALQLRALALGKSGNLSEAKDLLRKLVEQGESDPETLGILGGRYKQLWIQSDQSDRSSLLASYDTYKRAYESSKNTYAGINFAATALYLNKRTEAAVTANQLLDTMKPETLDDHWGRATYAEACLLCEKFDEARSWYEKAVSGNPELYQAIAVMRRQARLNLKYLGREKSDLDDALPVPGVVAFAGHRVDDLRTQRSSGEEREPRFPEDKVPRVREAIQKCLFELGFVHGFGTAAAGSDLLFLESFVKRGVKPVVVMPFPEEDFRRISVGDGYWGNKFDELRSKWDIRLLSSDVPSETGEDQAFEDSNKEIQRLAADYAKRLDEKPQLVVVWDGKKSGDGPGGTADVVRQWELDGVTPKVIDITTL
jgi:tetratricopeptide (TPR) repeat protein